jgi:hypothetical protein
VFFLGSTGCCFEDEYQCAIPAGKEVFFPLLSAHWYNAPGEILTEEEMQQTVREFVDATVLLECFVDGVEIPNLFEHRESIASFDLELGDDNFYGDPPGTYSPTTFDGYFLMLRGLQEGDHAIRFRAFLETPDPVTSPMWLDVTYHLAVGPADMARFLRGDANHDGARDISDPVSILGWLFLDGPPPACGGEDVADAQDDGRVDISDAVFLLGYLFLGTESPPGPDCADGVGPAGCRVAVLPLALGA